MQVHCTFCPQSSMGRPESPCPHSEDHQPKAACPLCSKKKQVKTCDHWRQKYFCVQCYPANNCFCSPPKCKYFCGKCRIRPFFCVHGKRKNTCRYCSLAKRRKYEPSYSNELQGVESQANSFTTHQDREEHCSEDRNAFLECAE